MSSANEALSIFNDQISPEQKRHSFNFRMPSPEQPVQPMDVDTSGPIMLSPSKDATESFPHEKRLKLNSGLAKPKIRKLVSRKVEEDNRRAIWLRIFVKQIIGVKMLAIYFVVLLLAVFFGIVSKNDLRDDFYRRYQRQYHQFLYGVEDYCSQKFDFSPVEDALNVRVVGQWNAVERITQIFNQRQEETYTAIALLGPTGVGKSLMASIVKEKFQWQSNVHHFLWEMLATPERQFDHFQSFLFGIRQGRDIEWRCGRNLIVIDYLGNDDVEMVNKIDARLRFVSTKDDVRITVLFVFQGVLLKHDGSVDQLNRTIEKVYLRQLDETDLLECIRLEADEFGLKLDENPDLIEELISSIDVQKHGCKAVRAKVALQSKHSLQTS